MKAGRRGSLYGLAAALAWTCLPAIGTAQATQTPVARNVAPAQVTPIRSQQALDAYLKAHPVATTPLGKLPPLARQRFLDSLVFGERGLAGFDASDLSTELTGEDIAALLALFDARDYAGMVTPRHPIASARWRDQADSPGPLETGFDPLYRASRAGDERTARRLFDAMMAKSAGSPKAIGSLPERELVYLTRALELLTAEDATQADVARLQAVVAAMQARGIAQPQDHRMLYDLLLRTRQFDAARSYTSTHPNAGLPNLPRLIDPLGAAAPAHTVWRASADGSALTRSALDLRPTRILVTAGCHFSSDAAEDISGDPLLGPAFAAHAQWLMLPPGREDQDAIRDWNRRFPDAQAKQIYDRNEWSLFPAGWRMPVFFIVREGQVIDRVEGWRRGSDAGRQKLVDALRRAGLLDPLEPRHQGAASSNR